MQFTYNKLTPVLFLRFRYDITNLKISIDF